MSKIPLILCAVAATVPSAAAEGVTLEITLNRADLRSGDWRGRCAGADSVVITLAADVTTIPARAFADCNHLVSLTTAQGCRISSIGELAFMGCTRLREVSLPATVSSIGQRCFLECESLRSFDVPAGVTTIPSHCFEWCKNLTSVTLPKRLRKIGSAAFMYCFALERIDLPRGVTELGSNVFTECRSLQELTLPYTIREIGSYIASECVSLRHATLPAGLPTMGELMFSGCRNLETLTVGTRIPPKFECASFIFEPDEETLYSRCRLLVPTTTAYGKAHGWSLFTHIEPMP